MMLLHLDYNPKNNHKQSQLIIINQKTQRNLSCSFKTNHKKGSLLESAATLSIP